MRKWFKALVVSFTAAAALTLLAATVSAANVGAWAGATSMGTARWGASASLLPDGTVLVAGGENGSGTSTASTEIYTPTGAGTWAPGTAMSTPRAYHSARVLTNGKVMVIGGYNGGALASTEIYNPAGTSWSAGPSLNTARYKFASAVLLNGKVIVVGGYDGTGTAIKSTEIYDPNTNKWTAGPNLNTAREGAAASTLMDGRIVVFGGYDGSTTFNTAEIYSPATNTWAAISATMTSARRNARSVELPDGTILIAGGYNGTTILNTTEVYNVTANTFTADNTLVRGRRYSAITEIQDGKVLIAGGTDDGTAANSTTTEIGTFSTIMVKEQPTKPVLTDIGNAGNATDMMVMFKGAPNEAYVQEYRVYVLASGDTTIANGADASAITTTTKYVADPKKGANRMHLIKLPASLTKADGTAVDTSATSFKVYVLTKGKQGFGDTLSAVSDVTAFAFVARGSAANIPTPTIADSANAQTVADIRVIFKRPTDESGYLAAGGAGTYRIYLVPDTTTDTAFKASNWYANANYDYFDKAAPSNLAKSYIKTINGSTKDSNGVAFDPTKSYRVYIVAVGIKGQTDSVLSAQSKTLTLSPYVPGAYAVRSFSITKTGTGFTSDLLQVRFTEPTSVTSPNVQDYRIFLVNSTATLTQATAEANAGVAGNCYVYTPVSPVPTRLTTRTVQLGTGVKAYDGSTFNTLVTKGVYKVYILTYTGGATGNKLTGASVGTVTLN